MNETTEDNTGIKYWFNEIAEAKEREKEYRKEGQRIIDIYECKDKNKIAFNILYSNTDTLIPALYSATPRPVVQRRFKDDDPIGKAACDAGVRMLEYLVDTNIDGYETYHEGTLCAVIDALLPGRGVTRIKYDAEIGEYLEGEGESQESEIEVESQDQAEDASEPMQRKESELVCVDSISWDKVFFGYAKKWSKVPWVAFEETIDKDEAIRLFGAEMAAKIEFLDPEKEDKKDKDEHQGGKKTAIIYQIWDKDGGRKVRYVSKHYKDDYLKVDEDPLELSGFFPIPRPIVLLAKSNNLAVTAPYLVYENQAEEINKLTIRINKIIKAIRATGVYDSELGDDVKNIMSSEDNSLVPADKASALIDGGFDKSIWFMPIEQLVKVLRELVAARNEAKQVIYEVTGISDIIRGSTVASETASAQQLKSQWGTMRLKRNQGEVQRYCRDMMRIMLEIAATKFSEESWQKMTGLPYLSEMQVMQAQQVLQAAQQFGQQIPEQLQQTVQQAQQALQQPQWSQVLELLKDDVQRSFRIDIETNSTVLPEAIEDQKNISEVMTALGEYLQGVTPLIQSGSFPFEAAKAMMLSVVRRYQFGSQIESQINEMKEPPPPQPDTSAQDKQAELQAKQQSEQATMQADIQKIQATNQLEVQKLESSRLIEEGKAKTQIHIEQMRIDAERENEQVRIEAEQMLEKYKADLESSTQLEIARLQATVQMTQQEQVAEVY